MEPRRQRRLGPGPRAALPRVAGALAALVGAVLALSACQKPARPARVPVDDPMRVVQELRARSLPPGLSAPFRIRVQGPASSGSTVGGVLLGPPDRLRVDVQTPLRTSLYMLASDGASLHLWDAQRSTFYRGDDAVAVLLGLTGGAVNNGDLVRLLTAGLPLDGAPVLYSGVVEDGVLVVIEAPKGLAVRATLDPRPASVRALSLGRLDPACLTCELQDPLLQLKVTAIYRLGPLHLPQELELSLPSIGWQLSLSFSRWEQQEPVDAAFVIAPPAGATEKDLVGALEALAKSRSGGPSPSP